MFFDLEAKKLLHSGNGVSVLAPYDHPTTFVSVFVLIRDCAFQILHCRNARGRLVMNEHRDIEVTSLKSPRYMLQVHPYLIYAGLIVG
jgi:hypothetical protein